MRWQHCIDHADTKQKPLMGPDCLLGVVPQPTDSRLSETRSTDAPVTSEEEEAVITRSCTFSRLCPYSVTFCVKRADCCSRRVAR